ncbi:MAG: iron-sulfur cluster assembly scaffold protein [Chloroflexi bacterium]|nr:iron-sulfur cluster assembly scaffold protein [Chloroflexota bacterium]
MDRQEYIELILDYFNNPRNKGSLDDPDLLVNGGNPGCGDVVTLYVRVDEQDRITECKFEGHGCTISMAAASLVTELVPGKTLTQVQHMDYGEIIDTFGREVVQSRLRCATLALDTLQGGAREYPSRKAMGQKLIQPIVLAHTLLTE